MDKLKKYILITFDYELFLGERSGLILDCLIEPTKNIVAVLKEYNVKGLFFVDTAYLLHMGKHSHITQIKNDLKLVRSQLIQLAKEGHFLFPHLHPHWNGASYDETTNQWNLTGSNHYKVSDLNEHEQELLFYNSINSLNEIITEAGSKQKIDSYRAGGWSLQPFSTFKKHFIEHGIKNDFSVLPGVFQFSTSQEFDYSDCKQLVPYNFSESVCLEDNMGEFTEFPISIIKHSKKSLFRHKLQTKYQAKINNDSSFGRGIGQVAQNIDKKPILNTGIELKNEYEYLSMDFLSNAKFKTYLNYCMENDFIQFLSHPKLCSNHSIITFRKLLNTLTSKFEIISNYQTISQKFIK